MPGLKREFSHVLVILELTALDKDLLAVGGDASQRKYLEFEGGARFGCVEVNVKLFARPFDDNCQTRLAKHKTKTGGRGRGSVEGPGMVVIVWYDVSEWLVVW